MVLDLVMPRLFGDVTAENKSDLNFRSSFQLYSAVFSCFQLLDVPCCVAGVLEAAAVAVAGLDPLKRGVFSLIVAVSTVFWRLKFD